MRASGSSGLRSPPNGPRRNPSVSSDVGAPVKYLNLTIMPTVNPPPAYVALSAASQIASDNQKPTIKDGDELLPEFDGALFSERAVANINIFLDQLMYSFLATARSSTLATLKPAIEYTLKGKLARQAAESAEEELQELLSGNEYEEELANIPKDDDEAGEWDLETVWKRTRLRIMVYMRLGEMEDEDEERFVEEEHLNGDETEERPFSPSSGLVSWAAAIFLTSVLEYVAEQCVIVAGQAAYDRVSMKLAGKSQEEREAFEDFDDERVVVREQDVERLALNSLLGRIWRTWRKNMRTPKTGTPTGPVSAWRTANAVRSGSFGSARSPSAASGTNKSRSDSLDDLEEGDVNVIRGPVRSKSMFKIPTGDRKSYHFTSWQPYPSAASAHGHPPQRARSRSLPTPETRPFLQEEDPEAVPGEDEEEEEAEGKTETDAKSVSDGGTEQDGKDTDAYQDAKSEQDPKPESEAVAAGSVAAAAPVEAQEEAESHAEAQPGTAAKAEPQPETTTEPDSKEVEDVKDEEPADDKSKEVVEPADEVKEHNHSTLKSALAGGAVGVAVGGAVSAAAARLQHAGGFKTKDTSSTRDVPEPTKLSTAKLEEASNKDGHSPVSPLTDEEKRESAAVLGKEDRPFARQDGSTAPIMGTTSSSRKMKKPTPLDIQQEEDESAQLADQKPKGEEKPQNELLRMQAAFSKSPNRARAADQPRIVMPTPKYPTSAPGSATRPPTSEPGSASNLTPESAGGYMSASETPIRDDRPTSKPIAAVTSPKSPNSSTWFGDAPQHKQPTTTTTATNDNQGRSSADTGSIKSDKDFDDRLSGTQTVKKSLTPRNLREIEQPDSPRIRQETAEYENDRGPPPKPTYKASVTSAPAGDTLLRNGQIGSRAETKATRPPQAPPKSNKGGIQPRDARVQTQSTGEFADYFRTVQPSHGQNQPSPISPSRSPDKTSAGQTTLPGKSGVGANKVLGNLDKEQPKTPQDGSRGKVPRMNNLKMRAGRGEAQNNSDLIAFLKDGPPGSNGKPTPAASTLSSGNRASSQTSTSVPDSINSRSGLLSNKASSATNRTTLSSNPPSTTRTPSGNTVRSAGHVPQVNGEKSGGPVRKQRRVKDPYAIDVSDDEENGTDILTGLPRSRRNRGDEFGESLIEFLRNNEPPPDNGPKGIRISQNPGTGLGGKAPTQQNNTNHKQSLSGGLSNHPVGTPANSGPILPDGKRKEAALPDFLVNSRAGPNSTDSLGRASPAPGAGSPGPRTGGGARKEVSFDRLNDRDDSKDRGRSQSAGKEGRKGSASSQKGRLKMFRRGVGVNG